MSIKEEKPSGSDGLTKFLSCFFIVFLLCCALDSGLDVADVSLRSVAIEVLAWAFLRLILGNILPH
jgi:hypothetical protein